MRTMAALPEASLRVIGRPQPYDDVPMVTVVPQPPVSVSPCVYFFGCPAASRPTYTSSPSSFTSNSFARACASAGRYVLSCRNAKPYISPRPPPAQRYAMVCVVKHERLNSVIVLRVRSATKPTVHDRLGRLTTCAWSVASYVLPSTVPAFCHCWL